jgi:signal transduction histidine kinase/ActR/RegA family two-component response regulator
LRAAYFAAAALLAAAIALLILGLTVTSGRGGWRGLVVVALAVICLLLAGVAVAAITTAREALAGWDSAQQSAAEREQLQRRLRQSERLESLGQLVGGVAHDFNNLLNVIVGYTDFAAGQLADLAKSDDRLTSAQADIEQVRGAAQQASWLTRQLLTFARHDVSQPEALDLNDSVRDAEQLMRRALGEHIDLIMTPGDGLLPVQADRDQLKQVLVNLAANARDAMPTGGKLTIDTSNTDVDRAYAQSVPDLRPGQYVRLRVCDTGSGMDSATLDRAFEPFFTTKPKGHGTGLGLATVYGIITQAGGSVDIHSEPGLGTTVSALLPAAPAQAGCKLAARPATARGRGETILLVEDEESLRELAHRILSRNGYRVCVTATGSDAISRAADPGQVIDLLLTDVIMPEMLGNQVAGRVREARPELPVLFMSGYGQAVLASQPATGGRTDILDKPFTETDLLARVRQALDRRGQPADQRG